MLLLQLNSKPSWMENHCSWWVEHPLNSCYHYILLYIITGYVYNIGSFVYSDTVFVFPCEEAHVTCLDCFRTYCSSRLRDRQFMPHPDIGYTLGCPAGCEDSFIKEIHHFRLLTNTQVYLDTKLTMTTNFMINMTSFCWIKILILNFYIMHKRSKQLNIFIVLYIIIYFLFI